MDFFKIHSPWSPPPGLGFCPTPPSTCAAGCPGLATPVLALPPTETKSQVLYQTNTAFIVAPSRSAAGLEEQTVPSFSLPCQGFMKGHPCQVCTAEQVKRARALALVPAEGTWASHWPALALLCKRGGCCLLYLIPLRTLQGRPYTRRPPKARLQALPRPVNYQAVISSCLPDLYRSDSNKAVTIFLEQPREDVPSPDSLLITSTLPCSFFFFFNIN